MAKSQSGLAWMAIIAVLLFVLLLIFQEIPFIKGKIGIKRSIDIIVNINDEGSRVGAFLNTRTPDVSVPESVALHAAGYESDSSEIQYIVRQAGIPGIGIFMPPSSDGKPQEKLYGSTMALYRYPVDIPLPGGGRGRMEVVLDAP